MLPVVKVTYALQSSLDRAIDQYTKNLKKNIKLNEKDQKKWDYFVESERGKVQVTAQIQQGLKKYRQNIKALSVSQRKAEAHESGRLGDNMRASGLSKPNYYYHAHAMISGHDERAWRLRALLAEFELGIDDSYNGCWLPASTRHCGQKPFPKAVPHSRVHRANYYIWLTLRFRSVRNLETMIERLFSTRRDLQYSSFPPGVMLKKGEWKDPYDNL